MSRVYFGFPNSNININTLRSLPTAYRDLDTLRNNTQPRFNSYSLANYGGAQYTYQMRIYQNSLSGFVRWTYPGFKTGTDFWTDYVCSGPHSTITLDAFPAYPQNFQYWYVPNYGVWTYTKNFNLSVNDWPVVNGDSIQAVMY